MSLWEPVYPSPVQTVLLVQTVAVQTLLVYHIYVYVDPGTVFNKCTHGDHATCILRSEKVQTLLLSFFALFSVHQIFLTLNFLTLDPSP